MGCGLLARFDPHRLGEHVKGNRLVSGPKLAITSKAVHDFQQLFPRAEGDRQNMNIVFASRAAQVCRQIPAKAGELGISEPTIENQAVL